MTARLTTPAGFKVVRVDMATGDTADFAVNKVQGPGSKLPHRGFERPSHCQFGPDGALYVVDFGQISIAPEKGGIRVQQGTGHAVAHTAELRHRGPTAGRTGGRAVVRPEGSGRRLGDAGLLAHGASTSQTQGTEVNRRS